MSRRLFCVLLGILGGVASVGISDVGAQSVRLAPEPGVMGVRVSGRTVASPGTEGFDDVAQLMARGGPPRVFQASVRPGQAFVFDNVPPGTYSLSLRRYNGFKSVEVVVRREPVRNLSLTFERMFELPVTVTVDDGTARPGLIGFRALILGEVLQGFLNTQQGQRPLILPAGKTPFFVNPPNGYYVASLRAGNVDLTRQPIDLSATLAAPPTIALTLTKVPPTGRPTVTVSGRITSGQPDIEVVLIDDNRMSSTFSPPVARAVTDASGAFTLTDVPANLYALHLPPARNVVRNIVVLDEPVVVTVPLQAGSIVAGADVLVSTADGRRVPDWPAAISFEAVSSSSTTAFKVERQGFWGVLPPGSYVVRIVGLPDRFSVKALTAGSANLLQSPLVVPAGRPAEVISIELLVASSEFPLMGGATDARPAVR